LKSAINYSFQACLLLIPYFTLYQSMMRIVGHRGARGLAPENTLAAIRKGLEHQADEIEIDVRVSKDNVPILHHDKYVRDPSGKQLAIASHNYAELKAHKPDLATLGQTIPAVRQQAPMYLEIKPGVNVAPVVRLLSQYLKQGYRPKDFLLASFSFRTLKQLDKQLPDIQKIVNERWSGVRASYRARRLGTKRVSMQRQWLWKGFIGPMSRRGYELYSFTLNDPGLAKRWEPSGLAGVITDYPDRFQKPPTKQQASARQKPPATNPSASKKPVAAKTATSTHPHASTSKQATSKRLRQKATSKRLRQKATSANASSERASDRASSSTNSRNGQPASASRQDARSKKVSG
jgi:glycerophosphoryl diester phosphodiesterase